MQAYNIDYCAIVHGFKRKNEKVNCPSTYCSRTAPPFRLVLKSYEVSRATSRIVQ